MRLGGMGNNLSLLRLLTKKLKNSCQDNLRVWNSKKFGHARNSLRKKMEDFKAAEEGGWYRSQPARIQALSDEIL